MGSKVEDDDVLMFDGKVVNATTLDTTSSMAIPDTIAVVVNLIISVGTSARYDYPVVVGKKRAIGWELMYR